MRFSEKYDAAVCDECAIHMSKMCGKRILFTDSVIIVNAIRKYVPAFVVSLVLYSDSVEKTSHRKTKNYRVVQQHLDIHR